MRSLTITASPNQRATPSDSKAQAVIAARQETVEIRSACDAPAEPPAAQYPENLVASGARIGRIAALSDTGSLLVDFPGNPTGAPVVARSSVRITPADLQRSAVLVFEEGPLLRPVIIGLLEESPSRPDGQSPAASESEGQAPFAIDHEGLVVEADGRRLVVSADQELVLRCGRASITLTKAGKVLIRGAYLLSRSSGVNRIKGGSVQIN